MELEGVVTNVTALRRLRRRRRAPGRAGARLRAGRPLREGPGRGGEGGRSCGAGCWRSTWNGAASACRCALTGGGLREQHGKSGPAPRLAFRRDAAPVQAGDLQGDGQPQARPPGIPGAVRLHPVEAFEDERQLVRRDPRAGVSDGDAGRTPFEDPNSTSIRPFSGEYLAALSMRFRKRRMSSSMSPRTATPPLQPAVRGRSSGRGGAAPSGRRRRRAGRPARSGTAGRSGAPWPRRAMNSRSLESWMSRSTYCWRLIRVPRYSRPRAVPG